MKIFGLRIKTIKDEIYENLLPLSSDKFKNKIDYDHVSKTNPENVTNDGILCFHGNNMDAYYNQDGRRIYENNGAWYDYQTDIRV